MASDPALAAVAALVGRTGVIAVTQDGDEFHVAVTGQEDGRLTVLAPRMKVGGIDVLTLRFSVDDHTWQAQLVYEAAEYHSEELARVVLRVQSVEPYASGRRAHRDAVHAEGTLRVIEARNVLARNVYPVRVEDVSSTGLRFTCEYDAAPGDVFTVTVALADRPSLHVRATAVSVEPAPFGRRRVRARIDPPGGR
jgi:PilZ domain-containing protein